MPGSLRRLLNGLLLAATFLTIVPVRVRSDADGAAVAPGFYALVGAAIGGAGGGILAVADLAVGSLAASILAVAAMTALTGGLHQDGLADCADGLGVRGDPERRLAVMRDPVIGSFGTLALILWALLLTTSLAQLPTGDAVLALITAGAIGRWSALLHAQWTPPARADGLGASFTPSTITVIAAGLTAILAAVLCDVRSAGAATFAGLLTAAVTAWFARRAYGGRTGDTIGASVVLTEVVVVLVLLTFARH